MVDPIPLINVLTVLLIYFYHFVRVADLKRQVAKKDTEIITLRTRLVQLEQAAENSVLHTYEYMAKRQTRPSIPPTRS